MGKGLPVIHYVLLCCGGMVLLGIGISRTGTVRKGRGCGTLGPTGSDIWRRLDGDSGRQPSAGEHLVFGFSGASDGDGDEGMINE